MAATIFNAGDRARLDARIGRLAPDNRAQFGVMTPATMVCHLIDSLQVATGAVPAGAKHTFMANPVVRWLIIYLMPWPKAKAKTVPEMLRTKPSAWDADIARLRRELAAAAERGPHGQWAAHPAFGKLRGKDYGCLIHKHFDHHLGQFGV